MKYKYVVTSNVNIKTPKVNDMSEIKVKSIVNTDNIELHEEFPNGLILDIHQYANRVEYISNKRIIADEDLTLMFED